MYYDHKRGNGMNSKLPYYIAGLSRYLQPSCIYRRKLEKELQKADSREDMDYIADRVGYYNKLCPGTPTGDGAVMVSELSLKDGHSAYVIDTYEYLKWYPKKFRWNYMFGDITRIPPVPTIVKSRPIAGDNACSVLLNLDKLRHFTFLDDTIPFREKKNAFIFRGHITNKPHRIEFMERFFGHPMCEAGIISPHPDFPPDWTKAPITLWEHLNYKFIMALEGNDVASNLKWILSSNSVAIMPRPAYETWFMEGRLIPDYHYIEIKPDYSDLIDRLEYFIAHPEEAEVISRNANEYVAQFLDPEREKLISLMVLDKYFRMTGQK